MIIENGTIEVQRSNGGGIDATTGFPTAASASWGIPIPCQFVPIKYNALALRQNEPITERGYSILIDEQPFYADRVRLKDRCGRIVGEFSVVSIEPLEAVGQVKITV